MAGKLEGKVAVIVGAGQMPGDTPGNGRMVAERFAEEGAILLLVDINAAYAEDTLTAVEAYGAKASVLVADITREADCEAIARTAVERFGRIDILHNNVGRSRGDRSTTELDEAMWTELMDMNLKGMWLTCKHVLPVMIAQRSGCIINISSVASLSTQGGKTIAYKTGKGAVNTMTQHIAIENAAHGVRCNVILPGLIDTPMAINRRAAEQNLSREEVRAQRAARVPLGRSGTARDIANAAVFLASDDASYITGVVLPVDGGLLAKIG
jgi:NAD(P)-dependent dehydrogenase (short-subunit alcohol dehydrogenase family)